MGSEWEGVIRMYISGHHTHTELERHPGMHRTLIVSPISIGKCHSINILPPVHIQGDGLGTACSAYGVEV